MAEKHAMRRTWSTKHVLGGGAVIGAAALSIALWQHAQQPPVPELRSKAAHYQQRGEYSAAIIVLKNAIQAEPADAQTRFQLAKVYLDSGESESAEKEIRAALKLGYPAGAAMPVLAQSLVLQAQYQKALDETQAAAAGREPELLAVRAEAMCGLGRLDEARQVYAAVLQAAPGTVSAMLGLGRLALRTGHADEASVLSARALEAQPTNIPALLFQAELFRSTGRSNEAMRVYERVLSLNPGQRYAYILKADLEIALGQYQQAQADLDAVRKLAPKSILLSYTQTLLYFSQGKYQQAREAVQHLLRVAPNHAPSMLLAGAISLRLNSPYQAESHLREYLKHDPGNAYARKLLAASLLRSGQAGNAMDLLAPALEAGAKDVQLMALAGESHLQARDFRKAAELFQQASALAPGSAELRMSLGLSKLGMGELDNAIADLRAATELDRGAVDAGVALVRAEMDLKRYGQALASVETLERAHARNAAVADLKGSVHLAMGTQAKAREQFEHALALQPGYYPAAAHLAEMAMNGGDAGAARRHLHAFLEKNKDHVEALTALAILADREGKPQEATGWLEKAAAASSELRLSVGLVTQYLRTGQTRKALDLAGKLMVAHPENTDLLDLLGKGQLANGQTEAALSTYKALAAALPRSAQARMQVAALELLLKQDFAAESSLKDVLAIQPDFPAAQLALAELQVRKGQHELALMTAERMQRKHPRASAGYQLEGDILMARQQAARALAAYRRAYALTPNAELTIKISHALRQAGKSEQAVAQLAQWLRDHPGDQRVQLYRAEILLREKQYAQAAAQFEEVLAKDPRQVAALNNLALAYQRMKDARARQFAEKAVALAGDQPAVTDTLAWILVEEGELARGLAMLKKAHAQAPQARATAYHLAVAMSRSGDAQGARKLLETLLAGKGSFADEENARRLLAQLP